LADVASFTDRNATLHNYTYDALGRLTADAVTIPTGSSVDRTVTKLGYSFDTGGRPFQFTSYRPDGSVVNQVQRSYNGLGQLTAEYQAHAGAVDPATSLNVQYGYSFVATSGGPNHSRLVSMTYPNGRQLNYNYNGTPFDDSISRLTSLSDATTPTLEGYTYLGLDTVVKRAHPQPGVDLSYINTPGGSTDGGDQYTGLDRFGRVIDQYWSQAGTATDRFQYTYDRDSNRLMRSNAVNHAFDEVYTYDNFNQLTNFTRGSHTQGWTLDPLGNWTQFTNDGTANTQTRGNNTQNQITSLTGTGQYASLATPTYDANGNTLTDERGSSYRFDAWNRLVQATAGSATVNYSNDALGRRIQENTTLSRDLYYSKDWQVLEERVGVGSPSAQYVWSPVYVDALVEREGGLVGRLYVQQDANWNVTGLVDTSGAVRERYAYDPYGKATILDPAWATRTSSLFSWIYLHQGGRLDSTSGLYNFRMRDYSPTLGRWMQEDPITFAARDGNLYRFGRNAPSNVTDPSGLDVKIYLKPLFEFGTYLGDHITIIVTGTSEGDVTFNGGGGNSSGTGSHPKPHIGIRVPPGPYWSVTSPYDDPDDELWALYIAYSQLEQVPYSATGPNSNTYAHQLLNLAGFKVTPRAERRPRERPPSYETLTGRDPILPFELVPVGPTATMGWNDPTYGGPDYDECGRPRPKPVK
jgi:RHS repeat-associated protein